MGFSVNVLFYGDHAPLAVRCLSGLLRTADWSLVDDVRFAFNAVSTATQQYVTQVGHDLPVPCYLYRPQHGVNVGKYPLMRRMFYDPRVPLRSSRVMWFDDDTYFRPTASAAWWSEVWQLSQQWKLIGSLYHMLSRGRQYLAVPQQPWYTGKQLLPRHRFTFCTGGWWVADFAMLRRWEYPFPELHHNGGDTMLGELCRQQDTPIYRFNRDIAINADETGAESSSKRRGMESRWIWQDYVAGMPTQLEHQNFECEITPCGGHHADCMSLDRPKS